MNINLTSFSELLHGVNDAQLDNTITLGEKGLEVAEAEVGGHTYVATVPDQHTCDTNAKLRTLLFTAIAQSNAGAGEIMDEFLDRLYTRLLAAGHGDETPTYNKPLTLREVKQILAATGDANLATALTSFNKDKADLVDKVAKALADLDRIAREGGPDAIAAKDASAAFTAKLVEIYQAVQTGDKEGVAKLAALHDKLLAEAEPLRTADERKQFMKQVDAEIDSFRAAWNTKAGNEITEVRDAVTLKMLTLAESPGNDFADRLETIRALAQVNLEPASPETSLSLREGLDRFHSALDDIGTGLMKGADDLERLGRGDEAALLRDFATGKLADYAKQLQSRLVAVGQTTPESLAAATAKLRDFTDRVVKDVVLAATDGKGLAALQGELDSLQPPDIEFAPVDKCRPGEPDAAFAHVAPEIVKGRPFVVSAKSDRVCKQFADFTAALNDLIDRSASFPERSAGARLAAAIRLTHEELRREIAPAIENEVEVPGGLAGRLSGVLTRLRADFTVACNRAAESSFEELRAAVHRQLDEARGKASGFAQQRILGALTSGGEVIQQRLDALHAQLLEHSDARGPIPPGTVRTVIEEVRIGVDKFVQDALAMTFFSSAPQPSLGQSDFSDSVFFADPFQGLDEGYKDDIGKLLGQRNIDDSFERLYGGALRDFAEKTISAAVEEAILKHPKAQTLCDFQGEDLVGLNAVGREILEEVKENVTRSVRNLLRDTLRGDEVSQRTIDEIRRIVCDGNKDSGLLTTGLAKDVDSRIALVQLQMETDAEIVTVEAKKSAGLPRGNDVLGLDVSSLNEDQKESVFVLVKKFATSKFTEKNIKDLKSDDPDYRSKRDAVLKSELESGVTKGVREIIGNSLRSGALKFTDLTPGFARLLFLNETNNHTRETGVKLKAEGGIDIRLRETEDTLGFYEPEKLLKLLDECEVDRKKLDDLNEDALLNLLRTLQFCRAVNYGSLNGLADVCRRLFGCAPMEVTYERYKAVSDDASEYEDEVHKTTVKVEKANRKINNGTGTPEDYETASIDFNRDWRGYVDPLLFISESERSAMLFLLGQKSPAGANSTQVVAQLLADLRTLPPGEKCWGSFDGGQFNLKVDENGSLQAELQLTLLVDEKTGIRRSLHYHGRNKDAFTRTHVFLPMRLPVDRATFLAQLENEVAQNVKEYGRKAAFALLPAEGDVSSRTRQLCINMLVSYLGMRTADFAQVSTADLLKAARALLDPQSPEQTPEERKARLESFFSAEGQVTLLNSEGTLELYRTLETVDPQELDEKVYVPDPPRKRKGETTLQTRDRQIHEFVADLVQPQDTTKFDLARERGMSGEEILRATLLAHGNELKMMLANRSHVESFTLPGGASGQKLERMRNTLSAALDRLQVLLAEFGNDFNLLLERLADVNDEKVKGFLSDFRADLTKSSTAVLGRLQTLFAQQLTEAFRTSFETGSDRKLWQKTLDEIGGGGKLDVEHGYGKFLMDTINDYFTSMDEVDRDRMAAMLMRHTSNGSSLGQTLGALLKGAGPILQKLMQGVPISVLPPELRTAVQDLKCNLSPIPEQAVRAYLYDMVANSGGRVKRVEVARSLGAASVGQAFLCRIFTDEHPDGEECVVKLLRPDVQNRAKREERFFRDKAAGIPGMTGQLKDRFDRIFEELDLVVEAGNVLKGGVYNPQASRDGVTTVGSMQLHPAFSATSNMMVLRKAEGDTVDNFLNDLPRRLEKVTEGLDEARRQDGTVFYKATNLSHLTAMRFELKALRAEMHERQKQLLTFTERWFYNAVFGDGFFHGDLHAGNIMTSPGGLTVIDYGNATQLTEEQRGQFIWMLAAVAGRQPEVFLSNFKSMLSKEGVTVYGKNAKDILADLKDIFARGDMKDAGKVFVAAVQLIESKGVEIPGPVFNLVQSLRRLDETVRTMNESITRIDYILDNTRADFGNGERMLWFEKLEPLKTKILESAEQINTSINTTASKQGSNAIVDVLSPIYKKIKEGTATVHKDDGTDVVVTVFEKTLYDALLGDFDRAREYIRDSIAFLSRCHDPMAFIAQYVETLKANLDDPLFPQGMSKDDLLGFSRKLYEETSRAVQESCTRSNFAYGRQYDVDRNVGDFTDALSSATNRGIQNTPDDFFLAHPINAKGILSGYKKSVANTNEVAQRMGGARKSNAELPASGLVNPNEVRIVETAVRGFSYPSAPDVMLKGKWATSPEKRAVVLDALKFNLARLRDVFRQVGSEGRMAQANRLAVAMTMTANFMAARHPVWRTSLSKLSQDSFDTLVRLPEVAADPYLVSLLIGLRVEEK